MGGGETSIVQACVLWGLFRMAVGSGHIEVLFVHYSDTCTEHLNTNPCDPMFAFCLSTPQTGSLSVDSCNYGSTGQSSGHFQNTNDIDMEHLTDIKGHPNPWMVTVDRFLGPLVMLAIKVMDVDIFGLDHMHTWATVLNETVWPGEEGAAWQERVASDNSHTLRFRVRMYCDANYYTRSCDVMCVPDDSLSGHYLCEAGTGRKVCLPGWQGVLCTEDIDECALSYCHSGECTNLPGNYYCSCPHNYTGKNCSILASPCRSSPCQNGGWCLGHPSVYDAFFCNCTDQRDGPTCNHSKDACQFQLCLNNGSCFNSTGYTCLCMYPFTGANCQVAEPGVSSTVNNISVDSTSTAATTDLSPTSTELSPTPTEESPASTVLYRTPTEESPTAAEESPTPTEESPTPTKESSTPTEESPTPTEESPTPTKESTIVNTTTNIREIPPAATKLTTESRQADGMRSTTAGTSLVDMEEVGQEEEVTHFQLWYIALIVTAILLAVAVVLMIVFYRRRRKAKHNVCPPLVTPAVTFDGTHLSFENGVYSHLNGDSSQTERQARELPEAPRAADSPAEEDLFDPTKPTSCVEAESITAAGNHGSNQSETKQVMTMDTPTLPAQPVSGRAEINPYTDFMSLTDGQRTPQTYGIQAGSQEADLVEGTASMPVDEYSDLVFNMDAQSAPVVRIPLSPYDIPSNNTSYYSTPSSRATMLHPTEDNRQSTTPLRSSDEIPAWTQATSGDNGDDSDSSRCAGNVQEDLARSRKDVQNSMSTADL